MGTSIITVVATVALLAILALGFTTSYQSQMHLTLQSQATLRLAGDRARTAVSTTLVSLSGNNNLSLTLQNTGSVEVFQFSQMDLMVNYTSASGQVISRLQYVAANPGAGQWTVQSISPAPVPGVWSPSASLVIQAQLPSNKSGGTGTAVVGTPNGVTTSAFF